jgi:hypothetical protein
VVGADVGAGFGDFLVAVEQSLVDAVGSGLQYLSGEGYPNQTWPPIDPNDFMCVNLGISCSNNG